MIAVTALGSGGRVPIRVVGIPAATRRARRRRRILASLRDASGVKRLLGRLVRKPDRGWSGG